MQTDIHHPTDNMLLWDTVRVITRLVGRLVQATGLRGRQRFHNRTRAARRRMPEIQRMTAKQREQQQTKKYRELIEWSKQRYGEENRGGDGWLEGILQLRGLGKEIWRGVDPDEYVRELREGWD